MSTNRSIYHFKRSTSPAFQPLPQEIKKRREIKKKGIKKSFPTPFFRFPIVIVCFFLYPGGYNRHCAFLRTITASTADPTRYDYKGSDKREGKVVGTKLNQKPCLFQILLGGLRFYRFLGTEDFFFSTFRRRARLI